MSALRWVVPMMIACTALACGDDSSATGSGSAVCTGADCGPVGGEPEPPECTSAADCSNSEVCAEGNCLGTECAIADDTAPCPATCKVCLHAGP